MAYKDEEEKRRKAQERKAEGEQYQKRRDELLKKNAELNAAKQTAPKPSATAMASGKSKTSMTAEKAGTSKPGFNQSKPDIANMSYDEAMGFATRIVYDDERDDFLLRWQKAHKDISPTMDQMRTHLNSQKPGGLYRASKDAYSKQVKERFKDTGTVKESDWKSKNTETEKEEEPYQMPKGGAVWNTNGEAYIIEDGKAVGVTPAATPAPIKPSAPTLQEALKDEKFKQRYLERLLEKEGKEAADFTQETLDSMIKKGIDSGDFAKFVADQAMANSVQVASAGPVHGMFGGKEEEKETFGPARPTIQQENEHSLAQAMRDEAFYGEYMSAVEAKNEIPYGSIDLSHDPIKAASYVAAGEVRQLTKETQDALAEIASQSPGWRAVMGVTIDPTQDQLQAAQDGDAHARAFVDATRDYWATGDTNAILGSTLTSYLNLSKSDRFPPSLRDDMQGAIAELAYRAEQAYKNGEFSYDPAKETLYDAYTKLNPASMQLVRGVKKQVNDMYLERKQQERLAVDEAVKNEQELLKEHREQVASGNYTQEAYDHVLLEAPQVTTQSARTDATYNAMFQEIAMDRTLSDGMEDSWYNQMAEVYLRENCLPDDLFSVAAMQYKDTLAAFEKDLLLSDMRVAATLDYADLGAMYKKWGGMDIDKLHERAEIALKQMAENVTDEDIAALESQNLYTGTGEEVSNVEAFGIGAAHGVLDTSSEMLEGIWAFSSMSKEDSIAAVYKVRQDWNKRYGVFAGTDMYKHAMYEYCDLIPEEHGKAIRAYLDAGYDPFRLGIDPTQESVILETSKKLDGRAKAIQKWAFGALDAKQGKVFEVGSATGSTLTMQTVATVTQLGTGNPLIGSLVGYGLVSGNRQIKEELANGATRKEAKTMGYLRAWSDSVANMLSSDKFTEKIRGFVGFGPLVAKGLDAAGDIASARGALGMIKRYGNIVGKAIKGAGEQLLEETVVDPMLEGTTWQIAEAGGRAYLGGAGFIQSVFKGLANIDVMESVDSTVKDAGVNFISTLPLAIIGGLGDGFKASRVAATKLMATGEADAAQEFVEAVVSDLEVPENRDALNAALHDAAVGEEAAVIAMTDDENGGKDIDVAAKAQEQADAHAKSEENSMAAAEAGREAALAAQERMNNGEVNPELVTQVANGVLANAKNSQSVLEHRREKNQKQAEADAAFAESMKKATAKAEEEVGEREEEIANPPQEQVDPAHNARVMEVNRYVEENYPNGVDDEQWQAIYDEFEADDGELSADEETAPEAKLTKANAEFAAQISRKFGVDVRFGNLAGAEGAYSRKANTIFLDQNATQGEMIKRVMVHELTHRTEDTAAYKELENALISLKYGENTKQLDADIAAKRREYQSQLAEMGRTGVFDEIGARKEIVADICSELISGNDEMINRLVAEKPSVARQILNAIKDFINRLRGVKDPELDNLRRIEGLLEQGLQEADAARMQTADAEYAKAAANGDRAEADQIIDEVAVERGLDPDTLVREDATGEPLPLEVIVDKKFNDLQFLISYPVGNKKPDLTLNPDGSVADIGERPENYVPKRIGYAYKLMEQHPDGTLHALFAGTDKAFELGTWNWAEGFTAEESPMVSDMNLFPRYGWHMGTGAPSTHHLMGVGDVYNPTMQYPSKTAKGIHPKGSKRVWCRVAYDATNDYNAVADNSGTNGIRGLIPFGGYYAFQEGNLSYWILSSALKFDKVLSEDERAQILKDAGVNEEEMWQKQVLPKKIKGELTRVIGSRNKGQTSEADAQQRIERLRELWDGNPNRPYGFDEQLDYTERKARGEKVKDPAAKRKKMTDEEQSASRETIASSIVDNPDYDDVQFSLKKDIEPDEQTKYNRFGWIRANNVLSPAEWANVTSGLNSHKEHGTHWKKNKDDRLIVQTWDHNNNLGVVAITDEDPIYPTVERVYRLNLKDDPETAKEYEEVILKYEQRWGYDALEALKPLVRFGGFEIYNAQDYRITQRNENGGGTGQYGGKNDQSSFGEQGRKDGSSEAERNVNISKSVNGDLQDTETAVFYTPEDAQMSLPSKPYLRQDISAWRKAKRAEAQREEESRKGERQFVGKTLQNSRAMPSYIRQTLFNDPTSRFYDRDSNDEQIIRAYQTIAQEGKEAAIEHILTSREMPTKDEIAQANVLMAQAAHDGDMSALLALSRHYAEDTTEVAQALQAMKIFKRMTPAGAMSAAAAQNEALLSGYIEGHAPVRQEVETEARRVSEDIEGKDGRDPIALLGSGETTLTRENSKWGIPINERQEALIKHYKLENVTRPGIHYNRATVKQRMLEAILATPDPLEATNEGMTLVTRLEYMKKGAPVITNADLEYIGRQLAIYTSMDADSQDAREGQLALARAYEANANITQAGKFEKINGARFINMLLNLTSPMRNVMGNVLQTSVNSLSNVVANILDAGVSLATKERTKAMITPKEAVEGWEAFAQETMDTYRDYFVDKAIVKHGEGRFDVNRRGRIYQGEAAETARITESFLMSVGDRNFWMMAYVNSMNEQMRVAKKNGVELDYEAARARAQQEANYATFNEDNKVRDAMNALKNAGIIGKGIDLLMPFTGVPTNIVKRQLEYGPIGLAYTSIKHAVRAANKESFDQKAFVEELARGLTGTGLMVLGFGLKQLGMITGGTSEEEDTAAYYMRTARGEQYTPFIKVGDQYVSLSTFAPAVSPILMGATAYDAWKNDENLLQAFANATAASLDSIIDASYFSAIQDILTGDGTFAENLEQTLLTSIATQSTPSLMSQMASFMDPYVRDTKDKNWMKQTLNKAIARVPILRETLPVKYDVTGEAVKNTKEGWRAFLDPFTTTEAENDKAVDELLALYKRTGEARGLTGYLISSNSYKLSVTKTAAKKAGAGSEGYSMELTTEQKQAINQKYADILFNGDDGIRKLIESRRWQTMSDEERVDEIADLRSEAKLEATVWAIEQYGKKE